MLGSAPQPERAAQLSTNAIARRIIIAPDTVVQDDLQNKEFAASVWPSAVAGHRPEPPEIGWKIQCNHLINNDWLGKIQCEIRICAARSHNRKTLNTEQIKSCKEIVLKSQLGETRGRASLLN
jgi:hypothetical protein